MHNFFYNLLNQKLTSVPYYIIHKDKKNIENYLKTFQLENLSKFVDPSTFGKSRLWYFYQTLLWSITEQMLYNLLVKWFYSIMNVLEYSNREQRWTHNEYSFN